MPSWRLENADEIAAANKYTFFKPSRESIALVQPGEVVKLIFSFDSDDPDAPGAERMWVLVESAGPDGVFTGRLDNEPGWIKDLKAGGPVSFDASHIISTEHDEDDNLVGRYVKRCFVTNRILCDGRPVGYLYREGPDYEDDSGWRFTAGDETDEYMEEADNSAYVSLSRLLSCDDSVIGLLDSPDGSAFVRDDSGGFVACEE